MKDFRGSLRQACDQGTFRVIHYSVQNDHLHLLVEAADKRAPGLDEASSGRWFDGWKYGL